MKLIIETYVKNGINYVWIGHEDGSGSSYSYNTVNDMTELISAYIKCNEVVKAW